MKAAINVVRRPLNLSQAWWTVKKRLSTKEDLFYPDVKSLKGRQNTKRLLELAAFDSMGVCVLNKRLQWRLSRKQPLKASGIDSSLNQSLIRKFM